MTEYVSSNVIDETLKQSSKQITLSLLLTVTTARRFHIKTFINTSFKNTGKYYTEITVGVSHRTYTVIVWYYNMDNIYNSNKNLRVINITKLLFVTDT